MKKIYNFSAGPAMLPREVLQQAQSELLNWQNTGASVMELSHRGKEFDQMAKEATEDLRQLLNVPNNYKILFCHGGARAQFAAVPMNILGNNTADYIDSGFWSMNAAKEAKKYGQIHHHYIKEEKHGLISLKPMNEWALSDHSAYIHYCPNETIDGVAIFEQPNFKDKIVVADFSSSILSQPTDVTRYGIIYAGAQKNIGPAGITIVIIRDDLIGHAKSFIPSVLDYQILANHDSMYNTPPTFTWYLSGLVFKWIKGLGGLTVMSIRNQEKAKRLYKFIDDSDFYHNNVADQNRSIMNIPFKAPTPELDKQFIVEASKTGILGIKGHRVAGGMRASIYNAMDLDGIDYLINFMDDFKHKHKKLL